MDHENKQAPAVSTEPERQDSAGVSEGQPSAAAPRLIEPDQDTVLTATGSRAPAALDKEAFATGPSSRNSSVSASQATVVPEVKAPERDHMVNPAHARPGRKRRFAGVAATLIAGLGLGWFAGLKTQSLDIPQSATWLQQSVGDLKHGFGSVQQAVVNGFERLAGPSLPAANTPTEQPNSADVFETAVNTLSAKLDQMRASSDNITRELGVEIERLRSSLERSQGELSVKLDQLAERVERQAVPPAVPAAAQTPNEVTSSSAVSSELPPPIQHPAIVADAKANPPSVLANARRGTEPTVIKQWRVREVLNGMALLEGPRGLIGVSQGQMVPGLGRVESIMRRGNRWVVATSKGVITAN